MDRDRIRRQLEEMADEAYRKFASPLIPNVDNLLGVRLPELRRLAKSIARNDWRSFLRHDDNRYFEETMLQGMVIGYVRTDIEELLQHTAAFVLRIDNWSVCDSFCAGLKFAKAHRRRVWEFLQPYLASDREFEIRFGVVMLLMYFADDEYIDRVLEWCGRIRHDGYYAKMAVAWAISVCFVRDPVRTLAWLEESAPDDFTHNMAIRKIIESRRVDADTKNRLRGMKRNPVRAARSGD